MWATYYPVWDSTEKRKFRSSSLAQMRRIPFRAVSSSPNWFFSTWGSREDFPEAVTALLIAAFYLMLVKQLLKSDREFGSCEPWLIRVWFQGELFFKDCFIVIFILSIRFIWLQWTNTFVVLIVPPLNLFLTWLVQVGPTWPLPEWGGLQLGLNSDWAFKGIIPK